MDTELFAITGLVYKIIRIVRDNISREMALSQLDIMSVLLKIIVVEFDILCLDIIVSFFQLY